jgi:endonuclease-3
MKSMRIKIADVNQKLIEFYGIPQRNKNTPTPLTALIGTILSQNTNDKNSFKAYTALREKYPTWEEVAALPVSVLEMTIRAAGLARQKATAITEALQAIVEKHHKLDLDYLNGLSDKEALEDLTAMKGVGVKTASCVLLFSLFRNVCPVDTHVHRTLNRLGIVTTSAPEKTFWLIQDFLPENSAHTFHTNLIRLGREFCRPAKPFCPVCPLLKTCVFKGKTKESPDYKKNDFLLLDSL